MKILQETIREKGKAIGKEILKVDNFLNHQIDVKLLNEIGKEFKRRFGSKEITKILTIEASGIAIACLTAQYFDNVPVVFAKKLEASNLDQDVYESEVHSFTKNKTYKIRVSKNYINKDDKVLIIDDFLAHGKAASGLIEIVEQAGAKAVGVGIVIEKYFQNGRKFILDKNVQLESLAIIESLDNGKVNFK
ncbi:xanthine phosphoribosyltransferase [Desulfonispora thiosulfatigenes DSM 11270]|uniref:Xanthine phosphoribosyltransferase n=1 Tax=Desulfonispora thiosulfatigenes DSM 11270 TaxID=656914 RepID=A0A1W1VEB9_DESTI|nr:xanthine phosphoribosyltransferase [Desulfonispora thiosulfatigenes]SMB91563.1 xanthine phosphoribosyltransferase [Desulfonispora thiosulfatigenes DSM 11270]